MEELIRNFSQQFAWRPEVENGDRLPRTDKFIVCGMGGSALAAGLLKAANPKLDLLIHRDYGLPRVPDYFLRKSLIILNSYSGNTAETLDAGREAQELGLKLAVIASGGKLLDWAKQNSLPYVVVPGGLPPRMALGYGCKALAVLQNDENLGAVLGTTVLGNGELEILGESLASKLRGRIPVLYSSTINFPLAYHWKISFNETTKVPAFANAFPELNHNEIEADFGDQFFFIFLRNDRDDTRIGERFNHLQKIYERRGRPVEVVQLTGATVWSKIFRSVLLGSWTALHLARALGRDPLATPRIEEFKKLLV